MTRLDHIGISVADLDAQAAWYERALGLVPREPGGIPHLGIRFVFLVDLADGWSLELLEREGSPTASRADDPPAALLTHGFGHICLRVDDVDAMFAQLIECGATPRMQPGPAPIPGVKMAFVGDPEGNLIEILDRPGAPGTPPASKG